MTTDEKHEIIVLENLLSQIFMGELAGYGVATDQRQFYHLWVAVDSIISHPKIKHILKYLYGDKYQDFMDVFLQYFANINEIKILLDSIPQSDIKKNNLQNPAYVKLLQLSRNMGLTYMGLHKLCLDIIQRTNMRNFSIKDSDKKRFETAYKKGFEYKEEKQKQMMQDDFFQRRQQNENQI